MVDFSLFPISYSDCIKPTLPSLLLCWCVFASLRFFICLNDEWRCSSPLQTHIFCLKPYTDMKREHDCPLEAGCSKGHTTFFLTLARRHRKSTFFNVRSHMVGCKRAWEIVWPRSCLRGCVRSQFELLLGSDWVCVQLPTYFPMIQSVTIWEDFSEHKPTSSTSKSLWLQQDNYIIQAARLQRAKWWQQLCHLLWSSSGTFNFGWHILLFSPK